MIDPVFGMENVPFKPNNAQATSVFEDN